jgi:hypothetical protein
VCRLNRQPFSRPRKAPQFMARRPAVVTLGILTAKNVIECIGCTVVATGSMQRCHPIEQSGGSALPMYVLHLCFASPSFHLFGIISENRLLLSQMFLRNGAGKQEGRTGLPISAVMGLSWPHCLLGSRYMSHHTGVMKKSVQTNVRCRGGRKIDSVITLSDPT